MHKSPRAESSRAVACCLAAETVLSLLPYPAIRHPISHAWSHIVCHTHAHTERAPSLTARSTAGHVCKERVLPFFVYPCSLTRPSVPLHFGRGNSVRQPAYPRPFVLHILPFHFQIVRAKKKDTRSLSFFSAFTVSASIPTPFSQSPPFQHPSP